MGGTSGPPPNESMKTTNVPSDQVNSSVNQLVDSFCYLRGKSLLMKTILPFFAFFLSVSSIQAQFIGFSSEVVQVWDGVVGETDLTGYTTYRVYAEFENETDFLSGIYGNQMFLDDPFAVTPDDEDVAVYMDCDCYDHPYAGLTSYGLSNALISFLPEAEWDSYWTIGGVYQNEGALFLTSTASSPSPDDIGSAGFCEAFIDDGAIFTLSGAFNGLAGPDHKVLIMQVTTCSQSFDFELCLHVFVEGVQQNVQYYCTDELVTISSPCAIGASESEVSITEVDCANGTVDATIAIGAQEAESLALVAADGTIAANGMGNELTAENLALGDYLLEIVYGFDCATSTTITLVLPPELDTNNNGICDDQETVGCTDPEACNFAADVAISDAALCEYLPTYLIAGESMPEQFSMHSYTYPETEGSTYEWTAINGAIISGQGSAEVMINWGVQGVNGTLMVQETDANGCVGEVVYLYVVPVGGSDAPTSVFEVQEGSLKVFPNPAHSSVQVNFEGASANGDWELMVFDLTGRMQDRQRFIGPVHTLNVSQLASGQYFLVLRDGKQRWQNTLVVAR